MSSVTTQPSGYRPYLDGLRAIAVLSVLFYHGKLGCTGGFIGVDVFFVISGYLITGIILKDIDRGKFSMVEFWERRVRRILPALAVLVLFCIVAGWFLFLPQDLKELGRSVFAQALLISNVYFWKESGYFAAASEMKPLLHTWSLALEEQFYLILPFALFVISRVSRKAVLPAIVAVLIGSFGLSVYGSYHFASSNFYLLPTRAWELMMGSFLAAMPGHRSPARWATELVSWAGLAAIFAAIFLFDKDTRFPGLSALLPCAGTAMVIWANGCRITVSGRILGLKAVVFFGLISYSLYLWHWPVLVFSRYWHSTPFSPVQTFLLLVLSVLLATISWWLVETPFRKKVIFQQRSRIFAFGWTAAILILVSGFLLNHFRGFAGRLPADALQYASAAEDLGFVHELTLEQASKGQFAELGSGDKSRKARFLVWGDSFAMSAMPIFDRLAEENSIRGVAATHSATAPLVGFQSTTLDGKSAAYNEAIVNQIKTQEIGDVVLIAHWNYYDTDRGASERLRKGLIDTIEALHKSGVRVWIMRTFPRVTYDVPRALALAAWRDRDMNRLAVTNEDQKQVRAFQDAIFQGLEERYPNVTMLNPAGLFLGDDGRFQVSEDGHPLYRDDNHLTVLGALRLRPLVEPMFNGLLKRAPHDNHRSGEASRQSEYGV